MPLSTIPKVTQILAAGGTTTIPVTDYSTLYIFYGSGTMLGNWTIAESGTAYDGLQFECIYVGNFVLGAFNISFFGQVLTTIQATKRLKITATYYSGSWRVVVVNAANETGFIESTYMAADSVSNTALADMTRGTVKVGGVANAPTDLNAKTSAFILIGDGTDLISIGITGDIAITAGGVVSISNAVIVNADINASAAIAFSKLASLTSANIIVGSVGNVPTAVAVTGDVTITNAGVTAIGAAVIVNADINAAAAIAFSKLAPLTSASILVGSAGNVATGVAVTGDVSITNTGVTTIGAGKVLASMLGTSEKKYVLQIPVSFEAGEQCKNTIKISHAFSIDYMFSSVTKALAATNSGTITAAIGGVAVTNGQITVATSAPLDDQDEITPSALNTGAADSLVDFTTAKVTAGGRALLTIYISRT